AAICAAARTGHEAAPKSASTETRGLEIKISLSTTMRRARGQPFPKIFELIGVSLEFKSYETQKRPPDSGAVT
ncbi:hypothetical protein LJD42_27130, partial [Escherichia coli]|nr:hypothetical protein [Escherichia coli]